MGGDAHGSGTGRAILPGLRRDGRAAAAARAARPGNADGVDEQRRRVRSRLPPRLLGRAGRDLPSRLPQLANQEQFYLAFYGDDLAHRFTKVVEHDRQQWQYLDELMAEAHTYWDQIPPEQRDFDRAKAEFMRRYV